MLRVARILFPAMLAVCGVVGLPQAAGAAATTTLPISSFYQIVADTAHGHLFIVPNDGGGDILVTDLAGAVVTTITGQDGVAGITLSPDGGTLYAALGSGAAVTAISTSTLTQTASYPLPSGDIPAEVAVQSGKVWVSYGTATLSAIGDIDLGASTPAFQAQPNMGGWPATPEIAADPQDSGVLVAALPGTSPSWVASYDTAADPATVRASSDFFTGCGNQQDLAVAPGGTEFVLACAGTQAAEYRYSTADLSELGSYPDATFPNAVAIDASGDVAAGGRPATPSQNLFAYHQDSASPLNSYTLAGDLQPRGLAFAPDGSELFAVVTIGPGTSTPVSYELQVISQPTLTTSSLGLTGPPSAPLGSQVTLTGTLLIGDLPAPAGTAITIVRSVAGGGPATFPVTTAADGSYTLADTPPARGTYTYTASYAGDSSTATATATASVDVVGKPVTLTLTSGPSTRAYRSAIVVTAHLGPTDTNRTVSIYAQPVGSTSATLLASGKVNSAGNLSVRYTAPHSTRFRAVFAGDAEYQPKTVARTADVLAAVSESLGGYYGSTTIAGTTYLLFHRTRRLHVTVTVRPDKSGQCARIEVQEHYRGAWHLNVATGCGSLSGSSRLTGTLRLTHANLGYHYRIRARYVPTGGDPSNLGNASSWQYFIVRR